MPELITLTKEQIASFLPKRPTDSHKGSFGRVLSVCGSKNMVGCSVLSALGALRSGAGLVEVAFADVLYTALTSQLRETLFLPLRTDADGFLSDTNTDELLSAAKMATAVICGCGLGNVESTRKITTALIRESETALVLDADSLNAISGDLSVLNHRLCDILLTPHPAEMARLMKTDVSSVQADRGGAVTSFCEKYGVSVLLKGSGTLICDSEAKRLFVNPTGNSGLSKGGSGDLLSGIIGGLTAHTGDLLLSACAGAYIHGLTADILRDKMTEYCILPSDCADALPEVFSQILK